MTGSMNIKPPKQTYVRGSCNGGAPFLWKIPSMNTPFLPLHFIKKLGCSEKISRCTLEIKLEWPMLTSTSPLLLFLPTVMRGFLMVNSKSLPSKRAMASPLVSWVHTALDGLAGAGFKANNASAWLFVGCCSPDISVAFTAKMAAHGEEKQHTLYLCLHAAMFPTMLCAWE